MPRNRKRRHFLKRWSIAGIRKSIPLIYVSLAVLWDLWQSSPESHTIFLCRSTPLCITTTIWLNSPEYRFVISYGTLRYNPPVYFDITSLTSLMRNTTMLMWIQLLCIKGKKKTLHLNTSIHFRTQNHLIKTKPGRRKQCIFNIDFVSLSFSLSEIVCFEVLKSPAFKDSEF